MTALEIFTAMDGLVLPAIHRVFPAYSPCCILATRVAIEAAAYFGVQAAPLPVQVILYNAAFAAHLERRDELDVQRWFQEDGSHSVGIGFGGEQRGHWNGHLIAVAEDCFADFGISAAERPERGIITGDSIIGPRSAGADRWTAGNERGTVIQWRVIRDEDWKRAPDWRDERRRRKITGPLIRQIKARL